MPLWIAFAWGFAEATFFFLVPDVWLSFLALESLPLALAGTFAALAGALHGGGLMWLLADRARPLLAKIPGVGPALLRKVEEQMAARGFMSVMVGPLLGIPYKIYAVEAGVRRRSLAGFLLVSIPARYIRFFLATAAFWFAGRLMPFGIDGKRIAVLIFWIVFYALYFRRFGWRGR